MSQASPFYAFCHYGAIVFDQIGADFDLLKKKYNRFIDYSNLRDGEETDY